MNEQISTAVILAARREFNGKLPYPLVPIADGVCLLDRTLLLLDQLNYERIYIVSISLNLMLRVIPESLLYIIQTMPLQALWVRLLGSMGCLQRTSCL